MDHKPQSPARDNKAADPIRPRRRSKRHTKPSPGNPSSCFTYQTRSSSRRQSAGTATTQATTEQSHHPQQGSAAGRSNPDRSASRRAEAVRPGHGIPSHLAETPAADPPRGKATAYVPAVPEEEIPSHIEFVNDPAHEFWTWSRERQGWYHEDKDESTIIWAPAELD